MDHTQAMTYTRNGRTRNSRVYPELVTTPPAADREVAYYSALKLAARIDDDLTRGVRHYRNRAGELLETFDQVILAILQNDLLLAEPVLEAAA